MAGLSTLARLRIAVGLSSAEVTTGAVQVTAQLRGVQAEATKTKTAFDGIKSGALAGLGIGSGLAAFNLASKATQEFTSFLRDSVKAAAEDQLSQAQLTASLRANVTAWDGNSEAIEHHITASSSAGFTDDDLRTSLEKLVAATHDVSQAFDLQSIAIDLARFKHEDLAAATDELVKVQAGSFRSLKSLGIATTDITTSTQAFAAIQKVVAGQSDAFLATDAGKAEKLTVATQELSESFGRLASGPLADAQEGLANFFNLLSGAAVDRINQQGQDIADTAAAFVKNATLAQLQSARDATEKGIQDLSAQVSATSAIPVIGILISPSQKATLDALQQTLANLDAGINTFGQDFEDHADRIQHAAGVISGGLDEAARAQLALTVAIGTADGATKEEQAAAKAAAAEFKALGSVLDGFNSTVDLGSAHMDVYSADLDNLAMKAAAVKAPLDAGAAATTALTDALLLLPTTVNIDVVTRFQNAQQGAGIEQAVGGGGVAGNIDTPAGPSGSLPGTNSLKTQADAANKAVTDALRAAQQAAKDAAAAEAKYASEMRAALTTAYDAVDAAAKRYFSDVHDARLKDIQDARDAANAQIDAQEKAIRGVVDSQRALVDAALAHRQELALRADITNAQTPADQAKAQQALNDFLDQQRLAFLSSQADTQIAGLNGKKDANNTLATTQTQTENDRYQNELRVFADEEKALKTHIDKATKDWKFYFDEIARLAKAAGVADIVGIYPNPAKSPHAAAVTATNTTDYGIQSQITPHGDYVGGSKTGDVYLSGDLVGEVLDRRAGKLNTIYRPVSVSTGSQQ